jgi:uncharacterized protein
LDRANSLIEQYGYGIVAWCFLALTCGGFIKGALGVGTPLLTVPMMALVLPPQMAIALMAIPVVVANLWQYSQADRSTAVVGRFWPAFVGILIGTWIGVKILSVIDTRALLIVVGAAVIVFALLQSTNRYRLKLNSSMIKPAGAVFGSLAGLIGGLSSFFGPMMVVYLISIPNLSKNQFVSSISFLYISAVIPWALNLYLFGLLDGDLIIYSAFAVIPVTLGMVAGQRIRKFISEEKFKLLIISILLMSGIAMLWRAYQ